MAASRHEQIAQRAAQVIRSLNLSCIPASSVVVLQVPSDAKKHVPTLPAVLVCTFGQETLTVAGNKFDDWRYPIFLAAVDSADRDQTSSRDRWLKWRQDLIAAFHRTQMTITGLSVQRQSVTPKAIADMGLWFTRSLLISALQIDVDVRVQHAG